MRGSSGNSAARSDRTRRSPARSPFDSRANASISFATRFAGSTARMSRSTTAARSNARAWTRAAARSRVPAGAEGASAQARPPAVTVARASATLPSQPRARGRHGTGRICAPRIPSWLPKENHPSPRRDGPRKQLIVVDPIRHGVAAIVAAIPGCNVESRRHSPAGDDPDQSASDVEDLQVDPGRLWQVEFDLGKGVERVGVVLVQQDGRLILVPHSCHATLAAAPDTVRDGLTGAERDVADALPAVDLVR